MAPDEMDLFPDREELLAGLPTRRADALLFLIESRTAHLVARSRRAMEQFVSDADHDERELAFFTAFSQGLDPPLVPTIQDLERHSEQWAPLVAERPQVRAALAHRLGTKYRFTYQDAPGIRRALGLDDPQVRRAYRRLYRQPLQEVFAARVPRTDRLRWAWAALAARLDRLSPFWTAYSLTLTETVGATILALPIALASIGPLPGVAMLVVLGLVNIVTIAYMAEAVTRSGTTRYGSAYLGRLVGDYLGAAGSLVLSVSVFVLCLLVLPVFYIGVSTTLQDATSVWAPAWAGGLFLVGLYYLRRKSLNATVASALVVGAVNIVLLVVLAILAATHLRVEHLLHTDVPLLSGRPFEPSVLQLIFGVVLAAYFGHTSVSLCGRLVLRRDPSGRALVRGCTAAQATAVVLYCLFVLAVNGAVAPRVLAGESGTALAPLTTELGPLATVLGTLFVILGMGMGTVHFSLALSSLTREWLPSQAPPVVVLPRQRARLLFEQRRRWRPGNALRIGVTYLGLRDGDPAFRLEVMVDGEVHRTETSTTGSWAVLGPTGLASFGDRLTDLRGRGLSLVLDIGDADPQRVHLKTTSSWRTTVEGAWDTSGLGLADVLALADPDAELVGWIVRQGDVTVSEVARHTGEEEATVQARLRSLAEQGLLRETRGGAAYTARLAARRGRALPEDVWAALGQRPGPETLGGPAGRGSPSWRRVRGVLLGRRGRSVLAASPILVSFAATEWMLLTGSGSFAGLLGFIGVIVVSLVAGVFPVLLLVASRRKGDHVPMVVHRRLGHPVLLTGLYLLFLGSLLLHGLVIWEPPWLRAGAVLVAAGIVAMTVGMVRSGTFRPRLNIELSDDQGRGRTFFTVTADGRESTSHVTLDYGDGARHLQTAAGEIAAFSSLRHAVFEPSVARARTLPREVKIVVHRLTPEGDAEAIGGSVSVQTGGEVRRFDLELAKGQVVVPVTEATCRVDIEFTGMRDARPMGARP